MSLKIKLFISFFLVGVIPLLSVSAFSFHKTDTAIHNQVFAQNHSMHDVNKEQVFNHHDFIDERVTTFYQNHMQIEALENFSKAYQPFYIENSGAPQKLNSLKKDYSPDCNRDFFKTSQKSISTTGVNKNFAMSFRAASEITVSINEVNQASVKIASNSNQIQ